jgi:hypothetical protein
MLQSASTDDRDDLIDGIESVRDAIAVMTASEATDDAALVEAMGELADVLYYLDN